MKRIVSTNVWTDSKVVEKFSPEDKLFWVYLLTNPHTTMLGIYELPIKTAAFHLGYSKETIAVLLDRFETSYGLIKRSETTGEIAIKNYLRHSIITGGKPVMDSLMKDESRVKDKTLVQYVFENIESYDPDSINETVKEFMSRVLGETEKVEAEPPEKKETPIKDIVAYLNEVCGTRYRASSQNTVKHINARLNDGFIFEDFKKVIDWKAQNWMGDKKMQEFLRPQTLFGTKFEGYLNDAEQHMPKQKEPERPKSRFDALDTDYRKDLESRGVISGESVDWAMLDNEDYEKLKSYGVL